MLTLSDSYLSVHVRKMAESYPKWHNLLGQTMIIIKTIRYSNLYVHAAVLTHFVRNNRSSLLLELGYSTQHPIPTVLTGDTAIIVS